MNWLAISLSLNLLLAMGAIVLLWRFVPVSRQGRIPVDEELRAKLVRSTGSLGDKQRWVITLEILNPLELVAERSWIGGKFGNLTPGLMHRVVVKQTRDQLVMGMKENGVSVDARVVRLD